VPTIRVFEPALCCTTGVCGPDVDQALVDFTADLHHLQAQGIDIARHNLATEPTAFATDDTVRSFLQAAGSEGLPLTLVDGVTVAAGAYPTRSQLLRFAGLVVPSPVAPAGVTAQAPLGAPAADACGCGPAGCC
jgi:arsenite-transporting ATPase